MVLFSVKEPSRKDDVIIRRASCVSILKKSGFPRHKNPIVRPTRRNIPYEVIAIFRNDSGTTGLVNAARDFAINAVTETFFATPKASLKVFAFSSIRACFVNKPRRYKHRINVVFPAFSPPESIVRCELLTIRKHVCTTL